MSPYDDYISLPFGFFGLSRELFVELCGSATIVSSLLNRRIRRDDHQVALPVWDTNCRDPWGGVVPRLHYEIFVDADPCAVSSGVFPVARPEEDPIPDVNFLSRFRSPRFLYQEYPSLALVGSCSNSFSRASLDNLLTLRDQIEISSLCP